MKNVARFGVLGLVAAACSAPGQNAPPAAGPGYQQAPLAQVPPPSAYGHPGFAYYNQPQQPVNAPAMPPAFSRNDRINFGHLQSMSMQARRCNVPLEVADGVFVHVDCHPYQRIPIAVKHATSLKLGMMRLGQVRWNGSLQNGNLRGGGAGGAVPHSMNDGAPAHAILGFAAGDFPGGSVGAAPLPDVVDHRLNGLEGPVKDQGDVGACTAFALSAVMDNALRRGNQNITTSPEHIWAHYAVPTMEDAAQGNLNKTITTFELLPYSGKEACQLTRDLTDDCGQTYGVLPNTASSDAGLQQRLRAADASGGRRVIAYEELEVRPVNIDEVVATLASGADLWAGFDVDSSAWTNRKMQSFVIPDWSSSDGGHAVAIAGYRKVNGGMQFLIHNSWGPKWGDAGYAWISQAMVQRYMHLAYKVRTDVDAGSPTSPVKPKTDEDCPGDQVIDSVTSACAGICPNQSRPANGQCPSGPAPAAQALPLPNIPGWPVGLPTIPGWPMPNAAPAQPAPSGQAAQPAQPQPAPATSGAPPAAPWQIPSAWPSAWPQMWPPPPPAK
jgi:hypothetical protein